MSLEIFNELMSHKEAAGFLKDKERGTLQSVEIDRWKCDELEDEAEALGDWIAAVREIAAGEEGVVINDFLNFNKGLKVGGWHTDTPSDPDRNTGRLLAYAMQDGECASLRVRVGDVELEIVVPKGAPASYRL